MNASSDLTLEDNIKQFFKDKNIGHAYLVYTDDINDILFIIKNIYKIFDETNKLPENLNELIENNTYSDLKIIESDGQWIKKEQILELQANFSKRSMFDNKRIYIIKNAEDLNSSSANTLLKFLEEPNDDIIAFLMTKNIYKVIKTIVSRCQYIALRPNILEKRIVQEKSINIIYLIETKKNKSIAYLTDLLNDSFDKKEIKEILLDLVYVYYIAHNSKINQEFQVMEQLYDIVNKLKEKNDIGLLNKKVITIIETIEILDYNINLKLLLDKLIISMFGVE